MKKFLMGTSAIALAGAYAGQAQATTWDVDVGGFGNFYVGYGQTDLGWTSTADYDGVDTHQDIEIIFEPSITLENGLTFGLNAQLEGNQSGDQIDESYAFVRGSFGEVLIGDENSAGYKMTYGAPSVFLAVNSGSTTSFIPFSGAAAGRNVADDVFRGTLGASFVEVDRNNDAARLSYFSPRFAGFQVGVSYARDAFQDNNAQQNINSFNSLNNIFDIGANYVNSFAGFDVALSGRYGMASLDNVTDGSGTVVSGDPSVWAAGLNLGYGGITIGGSYAEMDGDDLSNNDGTFYDLGVSYETGPWGFSLTYARGEDQDDENFVAGSLGAGGGVRSEEELTQIVGNVAYALGPGVTAGLFAGYVEFDEEAFDTGAAGGDDLDGFLVGTGFKLSF